MTHLNAAQNAGFRPDPMYIRRADMRDVEAIAHLLVSVQEIHVAARPDVFKPMVIDNFLLETVAGQIDDPDAVTFIGEVNGAVIGYVYVVVIERPESVFTWAQRYAYVNQISVLPGFRGLGYGELLMRRVIDFANEYDLLRLQLDVWAFNEGATDFYERLGFRISNHRMELRLD